MQTVADIVKRLFSSPPRSSARPGDERTRAQAADHAAVSFEAILAFGAAGKCIACSPDPSPVLGADGPAIIGRTLPETAAADDASAIADWWNAVSESDDANAPPLVYRRREDDPMGKPVHLEARLLPPGDDAGTCRVILRDVTERVRLERLLRDQAADAAEAIAARADLLASAASEIRAPLGGTLAFAQLLQRCDLAPDQARIADRIAHSARAMMAVLDDLLDVARIDAGRIGIEPVPADVARIVEDCVALARGTGVAPDPPIELAIDPRMPVAALVDPGRLRQVLNVLIRLARRDAAADRLAIVCDFCGDRFAIRIAATGPRHDNPPDAPAPGDEGDRGEELRLRLARRLVEAMGGTLLADAVPDSGPSFVLELPFRAPGREHRERRSHRVVEALRFPAAARVLLAMPGAAESRRIGAILARGNLAVTSAQGGDDLVDLVLDAEHHGRPFDLVLAALALPGCSGIEAARAIRLAGLQADQLPILILAAEDEASGASRGERAIVQDWLVHPWTAANLRSALQRWLPYRIVGEDSGTRGAGEAGHDLHARWQFRREAVLERLRQSDALGSADEAQVAELSHALSRLVGPAGLMGETSLAERAAEFLDALGAGAAPAIRYRLAERLLEAAQA